MLLKFRKKAAQYKEVYYFIFIIFWVIRMSTGFQFSGTVVHKIAFLCMGFFLALKLAVTDYSRREIIWMAAIMLLPGVNFLRNGERTLLLTIIGIFGAKDVSIEKLLPRVLAVKALSVAGTILCALLGIIENKVVVIPKSGVMTRLYCYGYDHPNGAYANLFLLFVLVILVYQDKLKWYVYVCLTAAMYAAYRILVCRTGWVVWLLLMIMLLGYWIAGKCRLQKKYLACFCMLPAISAILSFLLPIISNYNSFIGEKLQYYLTGRMRMIYAAMSDMGFLVLGHVPQRSFENGYFHIWYNYGCILFFFFLTVYILTMRYLLKKGKNYEVIIFGVMAVYTFMEGFSMSIAWNLPIVYVSKILFQEKNQLVREEHGN